MGCTGSSEEETELTESDIDKYVTDKTNPSEIYDIALSMRFSKENEAYSVVDYAQNDTTILISEAIELAEKFVIRNMYFKDGEIVYIEEFDKPYFETGNFVERKFYLNGDEVTSSYKRESNDEEEIEFLEFEKIIYSIDDFDFKRPGDAINQKGDYEMKYGEFLIIEPQRYLILENNESKYNVALFLMEGDMLIEQLYENPDDYRGKTIFIHHEFMDMNGVERMIYKGGIVKE